MAAPKGNQFAKGHGKGRPKVWTDDAISEMAQRLRDFIKRDEGVYINSFCVEEGIHRQRLDEWADSNQDFADALKDAKEWQEAKFIRKSLNKEWDGSFARYVMARTCGEKWKASYDAPVTSNDTYSGNITVNKIVSSES